MISKQIIFWGEPVTFTCDGKCSKAWGINSRPKIQLSDDDDDVVYLADGELPDAPIDPGTYEGGEGKPASIHEAPNKWCVRECERSSLTGGSVRRWENRLYNLSHRDENTGEIVSQ